MHIGLPVRGLYWYFFTYIRLLRKLLICFVFAAPYRWYSIGVEGAGDVDSVLWQVVRAFLISSGRSSVRAALPFHNHFPVCADTI